MWCKVVTALNGAAYERETVAGKKPEASEESGSPGVDHVSARSLQNSRINREAEKVSLAWVVRDAAEKYITDKWPLLAEEQQSS
jgi:hypothetical protein